jgi:uncharacterized protein YfaS (alpha-2-macroglobulin family)
MGPDRQAKTWPDWNPGAGLETQAYIGYALTHGAFEKRSGWEVLDPASRDTAMRRQLDRLYDRLAQLGPYGRALFALSLKKNGQNERAQSVLRGILQSLHRDEDKGTAWLPSADDSSWRWWCDQIEINSWVLRAVLAIEPAHPVAPELVQYLIQNRSGGHYWRSTRDTALAVAALGDYVIVRRESSDSRVSVQIDDRPIRELAITPSDFISSNVRLSLDGAELRSGKHKVKLTKTGKGEVYYGCRLQYVTKEIQMLPETHGIAVERAYYRAASNSGLVSTLLKETDTIAVGDTIEVVVKFKADQPYEYVAFEDWKPPGCESVDVQSGERWVGGQWANVEHWDDRVLFFLYRIEPGEHVLRYRLRAEIPGHYHVLPARGFAMYTPEIWGRSGERRVIVTETNQ